MAQKHACEANFQLYNVSRCVFLCVWVCLFVQVWQRIQAFVCCYPITAGRGSNRSAVRGDVVRRMDNGNQTKINFTEISLVMALATSHKIPHMSLKINPLSSTFKEKCIFLKWFMFQTPSYSSSYHQDHSGILYNMQYLWIRIPELEDIFISHSSNFK